ncbi:TPA: class D beta-lactamase [Candidatus Dependentiae bacterium]|nr:MAG: Class D beta-lactamase [candidate division TM6 bacterium GW2011_GWF2_36_131]KKQ03616.1 MAG: Class D beta-lactamase [candidate division TM6 bacterium GW2011_GWE2_36_25]KKQ20107.1 MAG: Class D beta-lactamase [candidate division TM6 bacterium GW2011_GWA2_36_9]HBR70651.1 class D beta-lactamase [Candidatus Dependentiae bacterium]HCU00271.1 class D beta-lactamase [Candidatus Dependentiae bacterium]
MNHKFSIFLFFLKPLCAQESILITQNNDVIYQAGDCNKRYSPCSTFKIAISLMGYNEKILKNESLPEWHYTSSYNAPFAKWQQSHSPSLWIKNSCVWYSQIITQKIGMEKFQSYVDMFNYGNKNILGSKLKNGLTHCWLSNSLKISVKEQVDFLNKLIKNQLPVSLEAHHFTRNLLFIEQLSLNCELYGKTGLGLINNKEIGWFIGWMKNNQDIFIFAAVLENQKEKIPLSQKAKKLVKDKLRELIKL